MDVLLVELGSLKDLAMGGQPNTWRLEMPQVPRMGECVTLTDKLEDGTTLTIVVQVLSINHAQQKDGSWFALCNCERMNLSEIPELLAKAMFPPN